MEADKHIIPRDHGARYDREEDAFHDTSATFPTAKCSFPVTSNILKTVLPGLLQATPAWSPTGAVYDMYPVATSAIPLMGATAATTLSSEGYHYTIIKKSPTASYSEKITNAVIRNMKLSLHPTENYGVLWAECEFIGTTYTNTDNTTLGETQEALTRTLMYPWGDLDIVLYGAQSLFSDFVSFSLDMTWGAKLSSDSPRSYMQFPRFESTCQVTAGQCAAMTTARASLRSQAVSDSKAITFTWGDGTASEAGELSISVFGRVDDFNDDDRAEGEVCTMTIAGNKGGAGEYPVSFSFYAA
jgi:hypothetical protein